MAREDICLGAILIHCTGTTAGFMESLRDRVREYFDKGSFFYYGSLRSLLLVGFSSYLNLMFFSLFSGELMEIKLNWYAPKCRKLSGASPFWCGKYKQNWPKTSVRNSLT